MKELFIYVCIEIKVAATFGKTLLENNIKLTTSYNQLYHSINLITDEELPLQKQEHINTSSTREARIEILEQRNKELSYRLEQLLSNQEELDRSHTLHSRHLEHEIENLQHCLTSATNKIHEISLKNRNFKKTFTKNDQQEERFCCIKANLEMEQLKIEFDHVNQLKLQKEKKLHESRHTVCLLQQQCEASQQAYEKLKKTWEAQTQHKEELTGTVEHYEAILTRLQERGILKSEEEFELYSSVHSYLQDDQEFYVYPQENSTREQDINPFEDDLISFVQYPSHQFQPLSIQHSHSTYQDEQERSPAATTHPASTRGGSIMSMPLSIVLSIWNWFTFFIIMVITALKLLKEGP